MRLRTHNDRTPGPGGFTLIELVVVMVAIGVMLAIIIHGVVDGVTKARRIQCANNMRQAALALGQYHELFGTLPPAWICRRSTEKAPQWGWYALLLPLLEQNQLYKNLSPGPTSISDILAQGPTGTQLFVGPLSATCPAGLSKPPAQARFFPQGEGVPRPWQPPGASYIASIGFFCRTGNYENHGVMYGNSAIPMKAVVDGTSSTFLLGERDWQGGAATWVGVADPQNPGAGGFGWVGGVVSVPMNCPVVQGFRDQGFSSRHPGGSQFAFCDASVRFISETIDFNNGTADRFDSTCDTLLTKVEKSQLGVYQQLGVRDDQRPIANGP